MEFETDLLIARTLTARALDALAVIGIALWLQGGVDAWSSWIGPSDFRRIAWLITAGLCFYRPLRDSSIVASAAESFWQSLCSSRSARWVLLSLAMGWAIALGVFQSLALRFSIYDVGIFHQVLWSISNGFGFWCSSNNGGGNFLLDHFSPSLALVALPFQFLGESPVALGVLHPIFLWGGVAAWIRLAEKMPGMSDFSRGRLAAGATIFGVTFQSLWANQHWGFHENSIYFLSISWALYFWIASENEWFRRGFTLLALIIGAFSKEILLLNVALFFIYWAYRDWRAGLGKRSLGSLLWAGMLIATFLYFQSIPKPVGKNYFEKYYSYLGGNSQGFLTAVLTRPWSIVSAIGVRELLTYPWWILPPFWPMVADRFVRGWRGLLLMAAPSIASAMLSTWPPLRRTGFHYCLEVWPVFAALTLIALSRRPKWIVPWAFCGVYLLASDPWNQMREYVHESSHTGEIRAWIHALPPEARIVSDESGGPWVTGRRFASKLDETKLLLQGCPDYLIFRDTSYGAAMASADMAVLMRRCLESDQIEDLASFPDGFYAGPFRAKRTAHAP